MHLKWCLYLSKGCITVIGDNETQGAFRNCALFTKCMIKSDGTMINDAEDLDLVILMYNLLECSSNHADRTGSLWVYSKDEKTNFNCHIVNTDVLKSFNDKSKLNR